MISCPSPTRTLAAASLLATGLVAGACAQTTPSNQRVQQMQQAREQLHQRFVAADRDGNGQLTRAEAQAGMPRVYGAFDQIDTARKGYVTEAEITAAIGARLRSWARRAALPLGLALASLAAVAPAHAQPADPDLFLEGAGGTIATLPAGVQRIADLPYGADPLQRMDVYLPSTPRSSADGPAPVIFMVHGGGWRTGDKAMSRVVQEKAARWVPRGFVFISVNYRLHPAVDVLQEAIDVAMALDTAQKQAAQWGADPAKFILMGHSAGAHLVSFVNAHAPLLRQLGVTPWLGTVSLDSALLNAPVVMSLPHYPLYDEVLGSDPAFWLAISPYQAVTGVVPPYQFVCSTSRPDRPCLQAQGMAAHVQALGGRAEVLPQDLTHGEINANLGRENDYTRAVETFMGSLDPVVAQRLR